MPVSDAEYERRIQTYDNAQLRQMLAALAAGRRLSGWASGRALEYLVLPQFQLEGAEVRWPFPVEMENELAEQIDGAVYYAGLACLLEAKDYRKPINIEPIAKLRNQLSRRPAGTLGIVFARSGYTVPAKILTRRANPLSILLWEFEELEFALEKQVICRGLVTKYRYAVEQGIPDFNITVGGGTLR